jgi:photosystem II stability/assembly factor-like uncharacterized protein
MIAGCSKKESSPIPPVTVDLPDTLSAGWKKVKVNGETFSDIYFKNTTEGFAASLSAVYKSADAGSSWTKIYNRGISWNLTGTPDGKLFLTNGDDSLISSFDGGSSFASNIISTNTSPFSDITFINNDTGFIAISGALASSLFQTTDGGHNWSAVAPLSGYNSRGNSNQFSFFLNSALGWIGSKGKLYRTSGSVHNWSVCNVDSAHLNRNTLPFACSPSIVYCLSSGDGAYLYKSSNGGVSFSLVKTFESGTGYADIHFTDDNNGYVCFKRKIYSTQDGGASWQTAVSLGNEDIVELYFIDAYHGWACGTSGTVLVFNR